MRFGRAKHALLTNATHQLNNRRVVEELREMGLRVDEDWRDHEWREQMFASLQVFHKIHGNSMVPINFVVPRDDPQWPVAAWGLPLGLRSRKLRENRDQLPQWMVDALATVDFSYDFLDTIWSTEILPSFRVYAEVHGNCDVGNKFVVPAEAPWPTAAWGLRLGTIVDGMRAKGTFATQVDRDAAELEAIGFVWDPSQDKWDNEILPALQVFYQLHNHSDVPHDFVVPSEAPWPKRAYKLKLGYVCSNMRRSGNYRTQRLRDRAALDAIRFSKKDTTLHYC